MMRAYVEAGRVLVDAEGAGGAVVGRAGSLEWVAARTAPGWVFVDWQAPLGEPVTYHAGGASSAPVILEGAADEVASLDGRLRTAIDRVPTRSRELERTRHEFWPARSDRPYVVHSGQRRRSEPVRFGATAAGTEVVDAILEQPRLVVRHNRALCRVRACTIPAVRLFDAGSLQVEFQGIDHEGEYNELTLQGVEPREPARPIPATTWADVAAAHATWADLAAAHATWASLRDS